MRIAIAGAHRVGKTTLAENLQKCLSGYVLTVEPYYELEDSGYLFSEIPDIDDFIKQFGLSIKQISESGDNIIFDRCPVDILAYIHAIDETKDLRLFFEEIQTVIAGIDFLVFVPVEDPDLIPCRESDLPDLRGRVDEILYDWIRAGLGVETLEVKGDLLTRSNQVLNKIA